MADDRKKQGKSKKQPDSFKPTSPEERAKALETALAHIEKEYGKGAVMKFGEKVNASEFDVVPTGSLSVDLALGIGGVPRGRIIEIYGPEASGKTTVTLHIVAQIQKAGGVAAFIDAEHALDPVYAKKLGVNIDELYISQPDNGEQALEIAEAMVRSCAIDIIIVDSVAALVPRAEIEGEMGDSHVGLHARLMSQALRKLAGIVYRNNCIVMFTNQLRDKIGVSYGSPETTTGGRALKFYASIRLDIRKAESIKVGEEIVGSRTKLKVAKNKLAPPFKTCEFDIIFGEGISRTGDVLDLAIDKGIANKSGAWFSYGEIRLGQGRENAKNYLKENPEILEEMENRVRGEFGLPPLNDAEEAAKAAITAPKNEPKGKGGKGKGAKAGQNSLDPDDVPLNIELIDLPDDDDLPEEFLAEFPEEELDFELPEEDK